MKKSNILKLQKALLLLAAIGLIPIALSYGLMPEMSLDLLFGIEASESNIKNIFRAVMGLYLALTVLWFIGAFKTRYREASLLSLIVFMFGLAAGRMVSMLADGIPHWLLIVYLLLEITFGSLGILLLKKT